MLHLFYRTLIALAVLLFSISAEARGRCDGFHACRCGTTAAREHGLPYVYHGINLKQARGWLAFVRTTPHAGAVGYVRGGGPTGHVFTVVSYSGGATAMVKDDAGTYERNIHHAVFVEPGTLDANGSPVEHHKRAHKMRTASAQTFAPIIH